MERRASAAGRVAVRRATTRFGASSQRRIAVPESRAVDLHGVAVAGGVRAVGGGARGDRAVVGRGVDERVGQIRPGPSGWTRCPDERERCRCRCSSRTARPTTCSPSVITPSPARRRSFAVGAMMSSVPTTCMMMCVSGKADPGRDRRVSGPRSRGRRGSSDRTARRRCSPRKNSACSAGPVGNRDFDDQVGAAGRRSGDGDGEVRQRLVRDGHASRFRSASAFRSERGIRSSCTG